MALLWQTCRAPADDSMTFVILRPQRTDSWTLSSDDDAPTELHVRFDCALAHTFLNQPPKRVEALDFIKGWLEYHPTPWLTPGFREWILDLDTLKGTFPELSSLGWLKGKVSLEPEVTISETKFSQYDRESQERRNGTRSPFAFFESETLFRVGPELVSRAAMIVEAPLGIHHSLAHFRLDFPNPADAAFIMMRFGAADGHRSILDGIKKALAAAGITGIRADERQYHDDLFNNVLTFMHGCGFGIAVFERLDEREFNPNVSLEVGYMLAMQKPVCILKDRLLTTLHTDLMGKMYSEFDSLEPAASLSKSLSAWLRQKNLGSMP